MQADDQATRPFPFYVETGTMTAPGRYAALLDGLPDDVAGLTAVGHGLLIHEFMTGGYGVTLPEGEHPTVHIRPVEQMLEQIVALDGRPLTVTRPPASRLVVNCRHFTVLMTTMLRAQGTPARARCGFGGYFGTQFQEDHWVCEYWHADQGRWRLVDAQIDETQLGWFPIDFDLTDVPRDKFLVGGQAWQLYRSGQADPDKFGLSQIHETGDWWIAANLMRDAAALGNVELLPWDVWGAMPGPEDEIGDDLAALFDRLAELTLDPDARVAELRQLCQEDERLRVPPKVRNAVRDRYEPI
jgi:hypothetical protein